MRDYCVTIHFIYHDSFVVIAESKLKIFQTIFKAKGDSGVAYSDKMVMAVILITIILLVLIKYSASRVLSNQGKHCRNVSLFSFF